MEDWRPFPPHAPQAVQKVKLRRPTPKRNNTEPQPLSLSLSRGRLSVCPFVRPSVCLSIRPSVRPSVRLSVSASLSRTHGFVASSLEKSLTSEALRLCLCHTEQGLGITWSFLCFASAACFFRDCRATMPQMSALEGKSGKLFRTAPSKRKNKRVICIILLADKEWGLNLSKRFERLRRQALGIGVQEGPPIIWRPSQSSLQAKPEVGSTC